MIEVKVTHDGVDESKPPSSDWVEQVVCQTLEVTKFEGACEVSVLLTDESKIRELNHDYRGIDRPTDVLSFAFEDGAMMSPPPGVPRMLGDVIIALPVLEKQAASNGVTLPRECAWALCHGTLHLLGYDHESDEEDEAMRALERQVLEKLDEGFYDW